MKLSKIIVLIFLILSFCQISNAQADCGYDFKLFVRDESGKTINNAQIEMRSENFYYDDQTETYSAWSLLGVGAKYKTLLKVKAKDFDKFEKEIQVKCGFYSYDLRLRKNSNEDAAFTQLTRVYGKILDSTDVGIPKAKVVAVLDGKLQYNSLSDLKGNFILFLPLGSYKLKISAEGFIESQVEKVNVSDFNSKELDITMIISSVTEHPPIIENNNKEEK